MLSPSVCVQRGHACVMRGVRGLSSQRSLMPCQPGRSLDGITGNWIVSHLLWEQPGWDPPSLSQYLLSPRLPQPMHPYSHPITEAHCTEPPAFTCHGKFPLAMQKRWSWMSAKCSIKWPPAWHQQQHQSPSTEQCITLMGGAICLEAAGFCWIPTAPIYHFYHKNAVRKDGWKKYGEWAKGSWW